MGEQYRDNYRRFRGKMAPAVDPKDLVRVQDLDALGIGAGSGIYTVSELFNPTPGFAPGGQEARFDLVIIRVSGSYDVVLPEAPLQGKRYEIKDGAGDGCFGGVTKRIVPSGSDTIEGIFTSFDLTNCYQSWSLIYDGSGIWRLV